MKRLKVRIQMWLAIKSLDRAMDKLVELGQNEPTKDKKDEIMDQICWLWGWQIEFRSVLKGTRHAV